MFQPHTLKTYATGPTVMFVLFYQTTWCHMSSDCKLKQVWHCAMARGLVVSFSLWRSRFDCRPVHV